MFFSLVYFVSSALHISVSTAQSCVAAAAAALFAAFWFGVVWFILRLITKPTKNQTPQTWPTWVWMVWGLISLGIGVVLAPEPSQAFSRFGIPLGVGIGSIIISNFICGRLEWIITHNESVLGHDRMRALRSSLWVLRWLGYGIGVLGALYSANVNIGGLLAGAGIIGVVAAFSVQQVLADLFAGVSIALDRPFSVGDTVTIGGETGTIRSIGLKSTRIKTGPSELIISNREISNGRITNFGVLAGSRLVVTIRLATPENPLVLIGLQAHIAEAVYKNTHIHPQRVRLLAQNDATVDYEIVSIVPRAQKDEFESIREATFASALSAAKRYAFPHEASQSDWGWEKPKTSA